MCKPFWIGLLLSMPLWLPGQPIDVDSLDRWLGDFPTAVKLDLLESLRDDVDRSPRVAERYDFARQLITYGQRRADTLVWQYGLEWLADAFRANGEAEKAARARAVLRRLAIAFGLPLDLGYTRTKEPYGYRYQRVELPIAVLEDAGAARTLEEVRKLRPGEDFSLNDIAERGFSADMTYWMRLDLRGPERSGASFTFVPASGYGEEGLLYSWDSIGIFLEYPNDSLVEKRTGLALPPGERLVRDAYPFFTVDVGAGERVTLYLRLRGGVAGREGQALFLEMVDRESLHEWNGYRLPARREELFPEGEAFRVRPITRSLELLIDDTDELGLDHVLEEWGERSTMNAWNIEDWDQIFWVRLRLLGTDRGAGPVLLRMPPAQAWDSVEVYWPNEAHRYVRQWMGRRTPLWKRPLPHSEQLLRLHVLPTDTLDVLFRLRGYAGDRTDRQIRLQQVWEDSFWPRQPYAAFFRGGLLGTLGLFMLLTLVTALLRADVRLLWFAGVLSGLAALALFVAPGAGGALLWPTGAGRYAVVALAGGWLVLAALARYGMALLRVPSLSKALGRWINLLLVLWTLVAAYAVAERLGVLPAGVRWPGAIAYGMGSLGLLMYVSLMVACVFALYQEERAGWLFLIALLFAGIGMVLAGAHTYIYGSLPLGEPVLWVSLAAWSLSLVFFWLAGEAKVVD